MEGFCYFLVLTKLRGNLRCMLMLTCWYQYGLVLEMWTNTSSNEDLSRRSTDFFKTELITSMYLIIDRPMLAKSLNMETASMMLTQYDNASTRMIRISACMLCMYVCYISQEMLSSNKAHVYSSSDSLKQLDISLLLCSFYKVTTNNTYWSQLDRSYRYDSGLME